MDPGEVHQMNEQFSYDVAAREVEKETRTVWVQTWNGWLWSKTEDVVNVKVLGRSAGNNGIIG